MHKLTKPFTFDTPITNFKGKLLNYARVTGKGYLYTQNFETLESDNDPEGLFGFDVEKVELQTGGDITAAYRLDKDLLGDIATIIDNAVQAHMQYLFKDEIDAKYGRLDRVIIRRNSDLEHTDLTQY